MSEVTEKAEEVKDEVGGKGGGGHSLASKLIVPAAAAAGTIVSTYAAKKVPDLISDHLMPKVQEKGDEQAQSMGKNAVQGARDAIGDQGGLVGKLGQKLLGGGGDDSDEEGGGDKHAPAQGWGRGRRLPVQIELDVAAPVDVVYDQWTQFEEFPQFMHRVEQIEQRDDRTLVWHENIWHVRRSWKSEIVEQVPNERIVWHSDSRGGHSGVITFHPMGDRLTRIEMNVDYQPEGLFEKMSSGLRFHRRALTTDMKRFKAFVEMRNEATGEWRGEIDERDENPAFAESDGDDSPRAEDRNGSSGGGNEDAEEQRKEREQRRRERQKTMGSSKR